MPKVRRTSPPAHIVVVDTNILWDKDKKLPVCRAFDDFWQRNSALIPLELQLPEVVLGELHFQQTTSALKALSNISDNFAELSGITQSTYSHKCNEQVIRGQVRGKLDKWLRGHSGTLVATPLTSIAWDVIVDAAVWRKPPFTNDPKDKINEKGFRDALILETLTHISEKAGSGKTVIFVCNDHLLRTTSETRLKASTKFLAFESLSDFEAYVNLTQQQLTDAFVKSIQKHARTKFYSKTDPSCIFTRLDIKSKIHNGFASDLALQQTMPTSLGLIGQAAFASSWKQINHGYWIKSTQFAKLVGAREFHWVSRVDVMQLFQSDPPSSLGASALSLFRRVQRVGFDVRWRANVKADGRFHDIELSEIVKTDVEVKDGSEENVKEWHLG